MMDLYNIETVEKECGRVVLKVIYDQDHPIFKGHFPSRPVVPGVMLMQTVKECFEQLEGISTVIESADLKFMNPVVPGVENGIFLEIRYEKDEEKYILKSSGYFDGKTFFKIKCRLKR